MKDHERLTASARQAWAERLEPGGPECLSDESLAELVTGMVEGAERERLAQHVVRCRACAETFRVLRELHLDAQASTRRSSAAGRPQTGPPERMERPRDRPPRPAPLVAAAASLVVSLGLTAAWLLEPAPTARDGLRAAPELVVSPADRSLLRRAPATLAWPEPVASGPFRVRLLDAEGTLLWSSPPIRREASRVDLPDVVLERLSAGSYFWVVETTTDPSAQRLGPYWFQIAGHE